MCVVYVRSPCDVVAARVFNSLLTVGYSNDIYAYCLTYSYSGVSHVVDCANVELGLESGIAHTDGLQYMDRPLALLAQKRMESEEAQSTATPAVEDATPSSIDSVGGPGPVIRASSTSGAPSIAAASVLTTSIPYYTNNSIAFLPTTGQKRN